MPTPLELRLMHLASREVGLDEEQRRMVLRNVGHVESSKLLDQRGFEDVMAVFEDSGFRHQGKPADYWRSKVATRGSFCGARVEHRIAELAAQQKYDLGGLCRRVSGERVGRVDRLSPQEGGELLEMLKAIIARNATDGPAGIEAAEAAGGLAEPLPGARTPSEVLPAAASL